MSDKRKGVMTNRFNNALDTREQRPDFPKPLPSRPHAFPHIPKYLSRLLRRV